MSDLIKKLKEEIIAQLNLEDVAPDDIDNNDPLFGGGLGLDSIDALELIVLLEKNYQLKLDSPEEGKKVFYSIQTLGDFIASKSN